jgi:acylphosphatase
MSRVTRRFLVAGKVQGAYFRHSTRGEAQRLGIAGYARNLPDGSVEVLACGAVQAVDERPIA